MRKDLLEHLQKALLRQAHDLLGANECGELDDIHERDSYIRRVENIAHLLEAVIADDLEDNVEEMVKAEKI